MNSIRIAVISSSFPPLSRGGVSSAHYSLLKVLKENDALEVKGFSFLDAEKSLSDAELGIERSGTPFWFFWILKKVLYFYFKFFDKNKISYQTSDIFVSSIGALRAALKIRRFQPDIVISSDHGSPLLFIMPFVKAKYVLILHHNPLRFFNNPLIGDMSYKDILLAIKLEKISLNKCDCIISPSKYMTDFSESSYSLPLKKIETIPNFLDLDFLDEIKPKKLNLDIKDNGFFYIFIPSAGSSIKGERYILSIVCFLNSLLKNRKISFILSGSLSTKLRFELEQVDISFFSLGQIEYTENISYLKSCDLVISPTLLENYGMAILEATCSGVPVVAFDVGGNKELIFNGENGYLVKYLDLADLCYKAKLLIENPLQKNAVKLISRERYSLDELKERFFKMIFNLNGENIF